MIKTIYKWLKIVRPSKKQIIIYLLLCLSIVLCYLFFPISYANIASSITAQSSQRAFLWAVINFLIHILTIITSHLLTQFIEQLKSKTYSDLFQLSNKDKERAYAIQIVTDYCSHFSDSFLLILKLIAIIFSALSYSILLSLAIILTSLLCFALSSLIQQYSNKKSKGQLSHYSFTPPNQISQITTEIIWTIFTLAITLITINLINTQKITLTVFLVITTFINTRLSKPEFNNGLRLKTLILKQALAELNNSCASNE